MSSVISAIYDALDATSVSVTKPDGTSVTASVRDADELPNSITTADLPIRLLWANDPFGGSNANSATVFHGQSGSSYYNLQWTITDMLYYTPVAQGLGVKSAAKNLLAYIADYYDMLSDSTRFSISTGDARVKDARADVDVMEYPLGSGVWYWGVRMTLTIDESICG